MFNGGSSGCAARNGTGCCRKDDSTFMDHPHLQAAFVENPEPTSPYGTKALGEPPACSPAPAIRNAVLQATGVAIDKAPLSPHILFTEFKPAGLL